MIDHAQVERPTTDDTRLAADLAVGAGRVLLDVRAQAESGRIAGTTADLRAAGDAAAQRFLAAALAAARPDDPILSEEAVDDRRRLDAERVWIIDPLDGTREFAERTDDGGWRDDFAVHLALWQRGRGLTDAAVALPARDRVHSSGDRGAARPDTEAVAAGRRPLRLAVSRSRPPAIVDRLADLADVELVPMGSAGVKAMAVVDGRVHAYVHAGGQFEWDSAAPVAVARAAGLVATRLDGTALAFNQADPWSPDLLICEPALVTLLGRLLESAGLDDVQECAPMSTHVLTQLGNLEAESIHIFREVAAEMERPCLLFSGGKDSIVMLNIARKAFAPARIPFPIMHIDTGLNFPEVLAFRDRWIEELGLQLIVASVQDAIERGLVREEPNGSRNRIQTGVLLEAVERYKFDALFGGGRRDEEKARAKERVFSFRDEFGQWDPRNQRPEIWNLYNGRVFPGESIRVFPLSNWTELDIWTYIATERIAIPELYLAADREVVERDGMFYAVNQFIPLRAGEATQIRRVRYRTIGDANLTAAVELDAHTVELIVEEIAAVRITERGATRGDDKVSEAAMEDRKREGYF